MALQTEFEKYFAVNQSGKKFPTLCSAASFSWSVAVEKGWFPLLGASTVPDTISQHRKRKPIAAVQLRSLMPDCSADSLLGTP
jgi:hypothetical protein